MSQHIALHLHTEFSLLDGASRIKDICKKAADEGMKALAITDHGTMYGLFQFYHEAKNQGIKPILGCEVYIVNGDHLKKGERKKLFHLVLLAKNDNGYKNLCKIVSEACLNGFYYKPRISKDFLKLYSEDLIALSACLGGEVNNKLSNRDYEGAKKAALEYKEIFKEDFYLEIQDHFYAEDRIVNPQIFKLAEELNLKVVATNDSHYTNSDDAIAHDALLCLQTQKFISEFPRMHFSSEEWLKTEEEMLSLFQDHLSQEQIHQAVLETPMEIFEKIDDYKSFSNPTMHMPKLELPGDHSYESYLQELSYEGAKTRFPKEYDEEKNPERYKAIKNRIDFELEIMNESGFASYFIVVADFINWAKSKNIPVGPGRGSAAGSMVAYCLGITNIDPIKYDLLFERFLNPERKSMPDIDTDFCIEGRDEVINYVREKYGQENVCQIITFNRLTSRAVLKDMARILEYPYSKAEELAKMIPVVRGKPRSVSWMLENHSDFKRFYNNDPEAKQVIELALKNEGLNKTFGVHAAGVIISDVPVVELIPISKNNDGSVITQFAMEECASMGLLKMDFLGLRNLTMIKNAIDIIHEHQLESDFEATRIDIDNISMEDTETFKTISSGNLAGIFQLETSSGMKDIAKKLSPESIEDISALIALYRPGPLDTGMIDDFINRKSGKEKITYEHPLLEDILKNTYGTIVYQEQIMKIAQVMAGFSLGEADLLRRAMGKKKPEVLMPFKDKFLTGCDEKEIPRNVSEKLFEQMLAFAEYCFNKSHSTAYGFITYQTAYLKTHYPVEYLTAVFMSCSGDTEKIKGYIVEAQRLNIEVAPPDINKSGIDFTAEVPSRKILFGLSAIKGVGSAPVQSIIEERNLQGDYKDFFDFCSRIDHKLVNKRTLEGLIRSGALDSLGAGRKAMIENMEIFIDASKRKQSEDSKGQVNLFAAAGIMDQDISPQFINGAQDEYPERELQSMEYELLGLFVSKHPMEAVKTLSLALAKYSIKNLEELKDGAKVSITALLTDFEKKITKAKKIICITQFEDMESRIEGVLFNNKLLEFEYLIEKGKRLLVSGTLSKNSEGTMSIMIDSLEDIDSLGTLEYEVNIEKLQDHFSFFQSLKNLIQKPENQGNNILVLKLKNSEGARALSLGSKFKVCDTETFRRSLTTVIDRHSSALAASN